MMVVNGCHYRHPPLGYYQQQYEERDQQSSKLQAS